MPDLDAVLAVEDDKYAGADDGQAHKDNRSTSQELGHEALHQPNDATRIEQLYSEIITVSSMNRT
jgi:hypothetical protein